MNLTQLTKKIWQIVGLVTGVLILIGILALVGSMGFGLHKNKAHHVDGIALNPQENESVLKTIVEYGLPLSAEGLEFLIVPVSLEKKRQGEQREEVMGEMAMMSSYKNYGSNDFSFSYWGPYYNLVFINKKTGEMRPLLNEKGCISGVHFPEKAYDKKGNEIKPTFILMRIAKSDTNQDGVINEKDATAGFVVSLDGSKMTQVTPDNTQMKSWSYDSDLQRLFIKIVHDSNKDRKFSWDDPQTVISVNPFDPNIGQEVVMADIKKSMDALLLQK